jgi:N-acetylneuraminic acid mutarotase
MHVSRATRALSFVVGVTTSIAVTSAALAGSWSEGAPIPTRRELASGGVIDGKFYVAGGWDPVTQTGLDVLEVYDPQADEWTTGAPLDIVVHSAVSATAGGELFLVGGLSGVQFLQTMRRFDPRTNTWSEEPQPFGSLRSSNAKAVGDEFSLYVVGRFSSQVTIGVWRFDIESNVWTQLSDIPQVAAGPAVSLRDGKIYVAGGIDLASSDPVVLDSLQIFDLATRTWATGAPLPTARFDALSGVIDDDVLIVGGLRELGFEGLPDLESYAPRKDDWETGPVMRTGRCYAVSGVIDDRLLVASGRDENGLMNSTLAIYDHAGKDDNVCICHYPPGNPLNPQTVCVGARAADRHIRQHADTLGECSF